MISWCLKKIYRYVCWGNCGEYPGTKLFVFSFLVSEQREQKSELATSTTTATTKMQRQEQQRQ